MLYNPYPYQREAREFFRRVLRGNYFAAPGTGKTATILDLVSSCELDDVLVIAPRLVALDVWAQEPKKWTNFNPLKVTLLTAKNPYDRKSELLARRRITVVNSDLLPWLLETCEERWPFTTVIFDESTRLKGYRTKQGAYRARLLSDKAFAGVVRWINLSGTPNANSYLDLWGPQWFVDGGKALGRDYTSFVSRWFGKKPYDDKYTPPSLLKGAEVEIIERLKPTTFRVSESVFPDLKKPIERTLYFDLPVAARLQYNRMKRELEAEFKEGKVTAMNAGVKTGKLRQIASGAVYSEGGKYVATQDDRMEVFRSIVTELAGEPLLTVYQYKHELERIQKYYKGAPDLRQQGAIDRWNKGELPLLLCHAASAGHGINLQHGGHHICFFTPYSDNELYSQVLERLGPVRQLQAGYKRSVYVHHIEARNTVDQRARELREGRLSAMQAFLEAIR